MSISPTIALAYCAQDELFAQKIDQDLKSVAKFRHFSAGDDNDGPTLSQQMHDFQGPVILLVSDNFLKSPNAMHHANRLLSNRGGRGNSAQTVLLSIERYDEQIGETVIVPAKVSRQVDIMGYINHWQERYLDLRRQKSALSKEIGPSFDQYLVKIREVSGQVNDFLHYLKDSMPLHLIEFSTDKYRQFFIFMDAEDQWNTFQLPQPVKVAPPAVVTPVEPPKVEEVIEAVETPPVVEEATEPVVEPAAMNNGIATSSATTTEEEEAVVPEPPVVSAEEISSKVDNLIQRAWSLADAGEWQTGLDLLEQGTNSYPGQPELAYHKALMFSTEADDIVAARNVLDELLEEQPDHQDALFLSGELYLANEEYTQAREHWELLADMNADYPDLGQELGLLLVDHYPGDELLALKQLEKAVEEDSEEVAVHYHYGRLVGGELNKPKKAIDALEKAVALAPDHALSHYELARQQQAIGQYDAALASYEKACKLEPSFQTAENEAAFAPPKAVEEIAPEPSKPEPSTPKQSAPKRRTSKKQSMITEQESGALSALKNNIAQLEALLKEREESTKAAEAEAAAALLQSRPGHGKTVMISGATSGIGKATAEALAKEGYRLIITGRRGDRLETIADELKTFDVDVQTLTFDVRDHGAVQSAIDSLGKKWSSIDILINNAGKAKGFDPIHKGDLDHWNEMIDVNLKGLLYLTRAVSPKMVRRKKGTIINVCSTAGKEVYTNGNVYCATKHAVDALTRGMRLDLVKYGIKVGQICPAHVEETEFAEVRFDGDKKRAAKVYADFQPLTSKDVADAVVFMLNRPDHVNILDMVLQGKQQASSSVIERSGR